jgi:hypothetical protein
LKNTRKSTMKLKATMKKIVNNIIEKEDEIRFIRNNTNGEE